MRSQPLIVPALLCLVSVTHAGGLDPSIAEMPELVQVLGSVHLTARAGDEGHADRLERWTRELVPRR